VLCYCKLADFMDELSILIHKLTQVRQQECEITNQNYTSCTKINKLWTLQFSFFLTAASKVKW